MSIIRNIRDGIRRATGRSASNSLVVPQDEQPLQSFHAACYAAHASMYFDQFGDVRACCQNTEAPMGNVTGSSIREIWDSSATQQLRDALQNDDFSVGCGFCQWQVDQGDESIVFARVFDRHEVRNERPSWPVQMEFSMTNSCNLQCVMCNGDWSSSIRTHREGRPPIPEVYGDAFFEELAEFLPHLRQVNLLGGEPFLGREPLRVLSMLAELEHPPSVAVTTNGTQWSPRIERICDRLPMSFVLSLDGITAETYESIRVGSDFELVMRNLERFEEHAERNGTMVSLAHCLMRPNVHEFSRLLTFAEERGLWIGINEVLFPSELSLFQLPPDELSAVIADLEADPLADSLDRLRPVWDGQLDALRHRLETVIGGQSVLIQPWSGRDLPTTWADRAGQVLAEWVEDETPTIVRFSGVGTTIEGLHVDTLETMGAGSARSAAELVRIVAAALGDAPVEPDQHSGLLHDVVIGPGPESTLVRMSWDDQLDDPTALVAVRNPPGRPPLPDDPWGAIVETARGRPVLVLVCDADELVTEVHGDPVGVLGLGLGDLLGVHTPAVFERLTEGSEHHRFSRGPSGRSADLRLDIELRDAPARRLRILVDRSSETTVAVAVEADDATGPA